MKSLHAQHERSRIQFNRQAQFYSDSAHFSKGKTLGIMERYMGEYSPKIVVDVATGAGFMAMTAAQIAHRVVGLDIADQLLALAVQNAKMKSLSNIEFVIGSAECMPIQTHAVDMVTCRIAAHHFGNITQFLQEAYRVLRPGGALALTDTICDSDLGAGEFLNKVERIRDPSHVECHSATWWETEIKRSGFDIRHIDIASNAEMSLSSWAARGGVSPVQLQQLVTQFSTATPRSVSAYRIRQDSTDTYFYWPTLSCLSIRR